MLCPAALSPSSAAAVTAASAAAARDKPMLPHSRRRPLPPAATSVVRVGLEHECARGHRVLLTANQCTATPASSTSAAVCAAPRASASDGATANTAACTTWTPQLDVPLYLPCEGCGLVEKQRRREQQECEGNQQAEPTAPLLSQLQRVFVVVPPGTTRSHHHPTEEQLLTHDPSPPGLHPSFCPGLVFTPTSRMGCGGHRRATRAASPRGAFHPCGAIRDQQRRRAQRRRHARHHGGTAGAASGYHRVPVLALRVPHGTSR